MISTISSVASHSVQNPQTLQQFLSPLYILHWSIASLQQWAHFTLCRQMYSMQHINYIFRRLWPFGWSESICTLYKSSYSTSSIDPLHLCNSEPISHSMGIHILYSISIITLQGLYSSAGPRAYAHYIGPQKAHPSFTNCISSKLQPIQLLCMHTYFMQHISHFLAKLWPFGWAESLFTPYITS